MSRIIVREATREDAFAVAALHLQDDVACGARPRPGFLDEFAAAWLAAHDSRTSWLAEQADGRPVGVATVARIRKLPSLRRPAHEWWHLSLLYVTPDCRGLGLGERLLTGVVEGARSAGVPRIQLNAVTEARTLYERMGFGPPADGLMELRMPV
ncbi:N-acetyltransferase family protein [Actinomycetota bacterium]